MVEWVVDQAMDGPTTIVLKVEAVPGEAHLSDKGLRADFQLKMVSVKHGFWQAGIDFPTDDRLDWRIFDGTGHFRDRESAIWLDRTDLTHIPWQGQTFGIARQILLDAMTGNHQKLLDKIESSRQQEAQRQASESKALPIVDHFFAQGEADRLGVSIDLLRRFTDLDDYVPDLAAPASP